MIPSLHITTQQHTSHQPPSGQGHATHPVLGAEGFTTESDELLETEGRISLTGAVCVQWAMVGRNEAYEAVKVGSICRVYIFIYVCAKVASMFSISIQLAFGSSHICRSVWFTAVHPLLPIRSAQWWLYIYSIYTSKRYIH